MMAGSEKDNIHCTRCFGRMSWRPTDDAREEELACEHCGRVVKHRRVGSHGVAPPVVADARPARDILENPTWRDMAAADYRTMLKQYEAIDGERTRVLAALDERKRKLYDDVGRLYRGLTGLGITVPAPSHSGRAKGKPRKYAACSLCGRQFTNALQYRGRGGSAVCKGGCWGGGAPQGTSE